MAHHTCMHGDMYAAPAGLVPRGVPHARAQRLLGWCPMGGSTLHHMHVCTHAHTHACTHAHAATTRLVPHGLWISCVHVCHTRACGGSPCSHAHTEEGNTCWAGASWVVDHACIYIACTQHTPHTCCVVFKAELRPCYLLLIYRTLKMTFL